MAEIEEKNKLRIGALLHDCGRIGIPDNIINKPDKLSDDEYTIIKNHTALGTNIIKHITNDGKVIHCVRSHHERWDGKGTQFDPNLVDIIIEMIKSPENYI